MTFLDDLDFPIVAAPMAGGPSTPQLAAAVSNAGALGFLAGGGLTPQALHDQIAQTRALTSKPFGVNLFMQGDAPVDTEALAGYRESLRAEAERHGATLGEPTADDDGWDGKLAVLAELRPPVVSFTFGCPAMAVIADLKERGCAVVVTVTSAAEAATATEAGADALCVQGAEAGGHRGTFDNPEPPNDLGLLPLLRNVITTVDTPVIAAGGLSSGPDIAAVLVAGARAAQLGTIFLACPESGAHKLHKESLSDPAFPATVVTRAFTGRPARALVNRFVLDHAADAPAAYPHVRSLTRDIVRTATQAGDTQAMFMLAGQGHRFAREVPAAQLVRSLAESARAALVSTTKRLDWLATGGGRDVVQGGP